MNLDLSFWTNASSKRKRIYSITIILVIGVFLLFIGSLVPVSPQEAKQLSNSLNQTLPSHKFSITNVGIIFSHNLFICLIEFVPVIGPIWGFLSFFLTGIGISAIANVQGLPPLSVFLILAILPHTWLEFTAYSIAITESIWLLRRLLQGRWQELKNTAILIGLCAILLFIGAIVEIWLISIGI
jgi:uncharacterized membrane protein SpoIIM required for sporulation